MASLYIGLISGTSVDAIDATLAKLPTNGDLTTIACYRHPIPKQLRATILTAFARDSLQLTLELDVLLGRLFAEAVIELLRRAATSPANVCAIGSHGQTISHQPCAVAPHTLQIGDPNIIAECTGITTVADFRRRDIAAGGQGAPLAPALHAALFGEDNRRRGVVNIGGIANLTFFPKHDPATVIGFDCGPGNGLMDAWVAKHLSTPIDTDAAWAAGGTVDPMLLERFLQEDYFAQPAPKSTGKEHFNLEWIEAQLGSHTGIVSDQDVQRTLAELSVHTIADAVRRYAPDCEELLVCGGGVHNPLLMAGLRQNLPEITVKTTAAYGVDPDYVEALAFAWLAKQTLNHLTGNMPFRHRCQPSGYPRRGVLRIVARWYQTPKDAPHPQVVTAFGLLTTNRAPIRSSL